MFAVSAIENGPADSNHALTTFSSCFPIQRKCQALLLVLQASGVDVVRVH